MMAGPTPAKRMMMDVGVSENTSTFAISQSETIVSYLKDIKHELAVQRNVLQDHSLKIESMAKLVEESKAKQQQIMLDVREIRMDCGKCKDNVVAINNAMNCITQLVEHPTPAQTQATVKEDTVEDYDYQSASKVTPANVSDYLLPAYVTHDDDDDVNNVDAEATSLPIETAPATDDSSHSGTAYEGHSMVESVNQSYGQSYMDSLGQAQSFAMEEDDSNEQLTKKKMMTKKRSLKAMDIFGDNPLSDGVSVNIFIPKRHGENCFSVVHQMCSKACAVYGDMNPGVDPPRSLFFDELPYDREDNRNQYSLIDRIVQQVDQMFDLGAHHSKFKSSLIRRKVVKAFSNIRTNAVRCRTRRERSLFYSQQRSGGQVQSINASGIDISEIIKQQYYGSGHDNNDQSIKQENCDNNSNRNDDSVQ